LLPSSLNYYRDLIPGLLGLKGVRISIDISDICPVEFHYHIPGSQTPLIRGASFSDTGEAQALIMGGHIRDRPKISGPVSTTT
jgi:hypothetical protein